MSMSSFADLFGGAKSKIDDKVASIFAGAAAPVARPKVAKRTVIEAPEPAEASDSQSDADSDANDSFHTPRKSMDNEDLESKYFEKLLTKEKGEDKDKESDSEGDEDDTANTPSHENTTAATTKTSKAKVVDLKENELEKAERTIFVGNVPIKVVNDKNIYAKFKKLFKKYGKIQSIRFRSISFGEALPRKVAFVQRKFHESRETLNAYIVYESKDVSLKVPQEVNGTEFDQCHLRVDHITHPAPRDHKRTIFVGNLNFEEKEESLWRYFNEKTANDVESVRIIRDSKTNLGKGFAYVQFKDTLSVNKALLLNDKPISAESKRKLRITRSKSHAKPSILSPNHVDNQKKSGANKKQRLANNLNDNQKTKLGRARSVLGKADRSTAGAKKVVIEGQRASKGDTVAGIKGRAKKPRHKKPRIRERSTKFKQERQNLNPK